MSPSSTNYSSFINTLNIPDDKDGSSSDDGKSSSEAIISNNQNSKTSASNLIDSNNIAIKEKLPIPANLPIIDTGNTANLDIKYEKTTQIIKKPVLNPIWLSVSESAKLGGVTQKTIRRAIHAKKLKYKIVKDRYRIDFSSVIAYLNRNTKLKNKLLFNGLGQYIHKWRI